MNKKTGGTRSKTAAKRRSPKRNGNDNTGRTLVWSALSAICMAGVFLLAWWFLGPSGVTPSHINGAHDNSAPLPAYEEPSYHNQRDEALLAIEEAIFLALRGAGVGPEATRIHFRSNNARGDVTEIGCPISSNDQMLAAVRSLDHQLAQTKAYGKWRQESDGRILQVYLEGDLTHRVQLWLPQSARKLPSETMEAPVAASSLNRAALVIDDMGYQLQPARTLTDLPLQLTFSILPYSPHGAQTSNLARKKGKEVLLHLPMQAKSYPRLKPGPGGLLVDMTPEELTLKTKKNLDSVPGVAGANNHMGSLFTENRRALRPVLQVLKSRGLFFLDSFTSPNSQAYGLARGMGLKTWRRHVFLDHDTNEEAIRLQMERFLSLAKRKDGVVAIGHPHESTIKVISQYAQRLQDEIRLVPVAELVR